MKKFKTVEEMKNYYNNPSGNGNLYEVIAKAILQNATTKNRTSYNGLSPLGKVDKYSKALKHSIEFKCGCGALSKEYTTKEMAIEKLNSFYNGENYGKDLVIYCPRFMVGDTENDILYNSFVFNSFDFMELLRKYKLLRVRKTSRNLYVVAIQQWQTSEKWGSKKTKEVENEIYNYLFGLDSFAEFLGID